MTDQTNPQVESVSATTVSRSKIIGVGICVVLLVVVFGVGFGDRSGYIPIDKVSSLFSNSKQTKASVIDLIRNQYMQSVVLVACTDASGSEVNRGSGVYFVAEDGTPSVETNAHVALPDFKNFYGCNVYFPRLPDGTFYSSAYWAGSANTYFDKQSVIDGVKVEGLDYAILTLTEPQKTSEGVPYPFPPAERSVYDTQKEACTDFKPLDLADRVFVLGYPAIGESSITITDGIVSGFTEDKIKISAVTNHGVSGGIVISPDTGCMLGIPTWVAGTSDGGSLGFLISSGYKQAFLDGLTGEGTYGAKVDTEKLVPYTAKNGSTFLRPEFWVGKEIAQQSVILKPTSRFDFLPGITIEKLADGNVRIVNPGGVAFVAPPEDIFDQSSANFRFLEGELPGTNARDTADAILSGVHLIYSGREKLIGTPSYFSTKDGYAAVRLIYTVRVESIGEDHVFEHVIIANKGRLYQFIFEVYGVDVVESGKISKKYSEILTKFDKVVSSIKIQ